MEWLSQNWIFLAVVLGAFLLMRRGGMGCCGHGGGKHHGHTDHAQHKGHDGPSSGSAEQAIDPLRGKPADSAKAAP